MAFVKVWRAGKSLGLTLPRQVVKQLELKEGDKLALKKASDGSFNLSAIDPELANQAKIARKVMRRYKGTLRRLAKE